MSRAAISAALARNDLTCGERLVTFSLASFADRDNRARPGTPAAAARAGLSRSRYLQARERIVRGDLILVEEEASGRGRASTLAMTFVAEGPWWDGDINAELFEAVLGYSHAGGPARLLLAAMAALADEHGVVYDLTTEQLCAAAGLADRTYRRARKALLASGQLILESGAGGRGNTNVWKVPDPRQRPDVQARRAPRRVTPPRGSRPLVATVAGPSPSDGFPREQGSTSGAKGGQDRTAGAGNRPVLTRVSGAKGGQAQTVSVHNRPVVTGVWAANGGQDRTLFDLLEVGTPAQKAAETPAETPAPNARAGREPQNPRIPEHPPCPLGGGSPPDSIFVEETYVTDRGRKRRRTVRVDLGEVRRGLSSATSDDHADWERIRLQLADVVGESTFAIWLEPIGLIAIDESGRLVLAVPEQTAQWVRKRFGRLMSRCVEGAGRAWRLASEPERRALEHQDQPQPAAVRAGRTEQKEAS